LIFFFGAGIGDFRDRLVERRRKRTACLIDRDILFDLRRIEEDRVVHRRLDFNAYQIRRQGIRHHKIIDPWRRKSRDRDRNRPTFDDQEAIGAGVVDRRRDPYVVLRIRRRAVEGGTAAFGGFRRSHGIGELHPIHGIVGDLNAMRGGRRRRGACLACSGVARAISAGPLPAFPPAPGRHARLVRVVRALEPLAFRSANPQRREHLPRRHAALHQFVRRRQPPRGLRRSLKLRKVR
jgi:hypothetical protein